MGLGKKSKAPSYKSTTLQNPYVKAYINKDGTSGYVLNDFLSNMNKSIEGTLPSLYNQLLYPNLDNEVAQARMSAFNDALNEQSNKQFENNINTLSQRGLLRSSALNDMTNKLSEYQTKQISNYAKELISNNTNEVSSLLNMFLNQYLLGSNLGQNAFSSALSANQLLNNHRLAQYQQSLQGNMLQNSQMGQFAAAMLKLLGTMDKEIDK